MDGKWPSLPALYDEEDGRHGAHGLEAASEDTSAADGGDRGALEPLWRFEAAHHFLLANELAHRHGAFVDGLYDAMERVQSAIERQSERVLAVLHDKDVRITELEEELSRRHGVTKEVCVQAAIKPQRRHVGVQCANGNEGEETRKVAAMQCRIEEQEEQIDVLMDELERLQKALTEMETSPKETRWEDASVGGENNRVGEERCMEKADGWAQTEGEMESVRREEVMTTIAALQAQLAALERANAAFQEVQMAKKSDSERLEKWERQLEDAVRAVESACECSIAPFSGCEEPASCLDLEHQLQVMDLEKEQLVNDVLQMRAVLSHGRLQEAIDPRDFAAPSHRDCVQVSCKFMLKHLLRVLKHAKTEHAQVNTSELRRELRRALRDHTDGDTAPIIARVVDHWMSWEQRHCDEVAAIHRRHRKDKDCVMVRVSKLLDEIQRLQQVTLDQEAELQLLRKRQSDSHQESRSHINDCDHPSIVEMNRRQVVLEQQIQSMKEQLHVANGVVRALSSSIDIPDFDSSQQAAPKDQLAIVAATQLAAIDTKNTVARLTARLQETMAQRFKRLQPTYVTRHNVLEYFRLEKECLHLRTELQQKGAEILQLRAYVADLEKSCAKQLNQRRMKEIEIIQREVTMGAKQDGNDALFIIYQMVSKLDARRNTELNTELSKARSRIYFLERDVHGMASSVKEESVRSWQRMISTLLEHHKSSVICLKEWISRYQRKTKEQAQNTNGLSSDDRNWIFDAYNVLLTQYESLALEFQAIDLDRHPSTSQETLPQDSANNAWGSHSLTKQWLLQERIHVLERRLLEGQVCLGCSKHVELDRPCQADVSTATNDLTSTGTKIEYRGPDTGNSLSSSTTLPQLPSLDTECEEPDQSRRGVVMEGTEHDRQLREIQHELEASVARIAELSLQKDKLKIRLDEAKKINKKQARDNEVLLSKVSDLSSSNAALSSQLLQYQRTQPQTVEAKRSNTGEGDKTTIPGTDTASLELQLQARKRENDDLRTQLEQWENRYKAAEQARTEAEQKLTALEVEMQADKSNREEEHTKSLETYMQRVNQTLESIERERARLAHENQDLQDKMRQLEMAVVAKATPKTRSSSTETDAEMELTRLLNLPAHLALQSRIITLESELGAERNHSEALRTELQLAKVNNQHQTEVQMKAKQDTQEKYAKLVDDLKSSHEMLQQEFIDYQAAAQDAAEQADKRIGFLLKCVKECSRLVDSSDKDVATRDLYDTVVSLSNRAISKSLENASKRGKENPKAIRVKAPSGENRSNSDEKTANHVETVRRELQTDTLRVRVSKLEASLRRAALKNKTFEDMIDHLEAQMSELREEVKDRMEKESSLVTRQGQMKVEVATLKSQCVTLTSRLAEACSDLTRTQDVLKAAESETARLRNALQRKSDLLLQQKKKSQDAQAALDSSVKHIAQLEAAEKSFSSTLSKHKEQAVQLQEVRRQCAMYRDSSAELSDKVDKLAQLKNDLQSRVKALRLENGLLRDQLRQLKTRVNDSEENELKSQDTLLQSTDPRSRESANKSVAAAAVEALNTQIKSLKKRVLDKQEVIVVYKTKVAELDAELMLQRTKAFDLAQSNRQQQQIHREKELTLMQGASSLKEELEAALATKNEQFDGLRASIFDACEVFVHCYQPSDSPKSTSSASSIAFSWPEDSSGGGLADDVLQELRRYADLSPDDLADLHITSSRQSSSKRHRSRQERHLEAVHLQHLKHKHGERVLRELEHALEVSPHDCRAEICQVLEFLTATPLVQSRPARRC